MSDFILTKRAFLTATASFIAAYALPASARGNHTAIHVLKDPNCGCCTDWIDIVKAEGFDVNVELSDPSALMQYKLANHIPAHMSSCHTARIDGYMIEGHVPVADMRRLLQERPQAVGLAVPGMPYGSPGMGPETEREAYNVILIKSNGAHQVYSHYAAATR